MVKGGISDMNKCVGGARFYGVVAGIGLGTLAVLGTAPPAQALTFDTGSLGNFVTSGSLAPEWIPTPEVPVEPQGPVLVSPPTIGAPESAAGYLEGQLFYSGPDEQPLTYSATAPAKGSVVMNQDGTFSYQPTVQARNIAAADPSEENLSDAFTVTVSNGVGPDVTVDVVVPISPKNHLPAVTVEILSFDWTDSVTTGRVIASDILDRDTVSLQAEATKGDISFAADGITFTYTPTHEARLAAANLDRRTDTLTFTGTDSYGGTAVETVDVSIEPYSVIELPPTGEVTYVSLDGHGVLAPSDIFGSAYLNDPNLQIVSGVDYPTQLPCCTFHVEGDDVVIVDEDGTEVGRTPLTGLFASRPE